MKIFIIGDTHLGLHPEVDKPMDIFGDRWENHAERLKENWIERISTDDYVIIAGDVSWGLKLEEAKADLDWLRALPGKKIFIKGNHDLWWQSLTKLNALFADEEGRPDPGMYFLQNEAYIIEVPAGYDGQTGTEKDGADAVIEKDEAVDIIEKDEADAADEMKLQTDATEKSGSESRDFRKRKIAICGTRGWTCPGTEAYSEDDKKVYKRELIRIEMSLQDAVRKGADEIIGVLHFPPTNDKKQVSGFTELFSKYGVKNVYYGHLHKPEKWPRGLNGVLNGVNYQLISLDYLDSVPKEILSV